MKKYLFFLIISISFLKADYYIKAYNNLGEIREYCAISFIGKNTTAIAPYTFNEFSHYSAYENYEVRFALFIDELDNPTYHNYILQVLDNYSFNSTTKTCDQIGTPNDITSQIVSYSVPTTTPNEETPTDTTTNETIYKYGLTETRFNFLSGLTGLLTAVLLVFVIYKKV